MRVLAHGVPLGRRAEFVATLTHPERTAYRDGVAWDAGFTFAIWPSRGAMMTTIRMQESGPPRLTNWRAVQR